MGDEICPELDDTTQQKDVPNQANTAGSVFRELFFFFLGGGVCVFC